MKFTTLICALISPALVFAESSDARIDRIVSEPRDYSKSIQINSDCFSKSQLLDSARQGKVAFLAKVDSAFRVSHSVACMLRNDYGVKVPFNARATQRGERDVEEDTTPEIGLSNWVQCSSWMNGSADLLHEIFKAKTNPEQTALRNHIQIKLKELPQRCSDINGAPLPMVTAFNAFLDDYSLAINNFISEKNERRRIELSSELERVRAQTGKQKDIEAQNATLVELEAKVADEKRLAITQAEEANRLALEKAKQIQDEQARIAMTEHIAALRGKKIPVNNMNDAALYLNAINDPKPISQPMLTPDQKIYAWYGWLERREGGIFVAKFGDNYFAFSKNSSTKVFNESEIRINGAIRVVGRYSSNINYSTVLGAARVMPVLDAEFIGLH